MIKANPDAMWHLIPFQKRLTRRRVFEEVIIALNNTAWRLDHEPPEVRLERGQSD